MRQISTFTYQHWKLFQAGDTAAFGELYNSFFSELYRYGYNFTAETPLIEDAIQDLFLRLWKNRANLNHPPHVRNYLFKAFRHHLIDKLSRQSQISNSTLEKAPDLALYITKETDLVQQECNKELCWKIEVALSQLTTKQRKAIFLRYYENLSYPEIADKFGLSPKATYKLIGRAIAALRKALSN